MIDDNSDIELKDNNTPIVGAMSDLRMQVLLDLLQELAGDCLDSPHIQRDPTPMIDKRTGKSQTRSSKGRSRFKRRRR